MNYEQVWSSRVDGAPDPYLLDSGNAPESDALIVLLHGHGSGYRQYYEWEILQALPRRIAERGWALLCPHGRGNAWMGPTVATDLADLIAETRRALRPRVVIISGGSMGGSSALAFAVAHPECADGVVAFCPATDIGAYYHYCVTEGPLPVQQEIASAIAAGYGGTPAERPEAYACHDAVEQAEKLRGKPVVVVHGDQDETIPVAQSRRLAAALNNSPGFEYREVPGGDHNSVLDMDVWVSALDRVVAAARHEE